MLRGTVTILTVAFCVTGGLAGVAEAKAPPPCAGRFAVPGAITLGGMSINAFTIAQNKKVSIGSCGASKGGPLHGKVKGTKTGTKVNVVWPKCGDIKAVKLTGSLGTDCTSFSGNIKAKKIAAQSLSALASTGCGDGVLDPGLGEGCEGTTGCAPGEQCTGCQCQPIPTTTTTATTIAPTSTTQAAVTTTSTSTTTTTTIPPPPHCGDGTLQADEGEECDDGNTIADDGCTDHCTICGNRVITPPETCDDGNHTGGDGCSSTCHLVVCGDHFVDPPETCDDGNTINFDDCPSNCIEQFCNPITGTMRQATVTWNAPSSVGGITVLVDYPEGHVNLPGTGGSIPAGILFGFPSGTSNQPKKLGTLGYALREVVVKASAISPRPGPLFKINFEDCQDTTPPTAGDFACVVQSAVAPDGVTAVPGATCAVTVP